MKIILIGASTGGPGLIESIVSKLPERMEAAIILAQHMNESLLPSFANRLKRVTSIPVTLVNKKSLVTEGNIFVLSKTSTILEIGTYAYIDTIDNGNTVYNPTIDYLFESASLLKKHSVVALLLSGIGSDGAKGLLKLKNTGFDTYTQDESSSIVFGMPKAAIEIGAACNIGSIESLTDIILEEV